MQEMNINPVYSGNLQNSQPGKNSENDYYSTPAAWVGNAKIPPSLVATAASGSGRNKQQGAEAYDQLEGGHAVYAKVSSPSHEELAGAELAYTRLQGQHALYDAKIGGSTTEEATYAKGYTNDDQSPYYARVDERRRTPKGQQQQQQQESAA